MRLAPLDASFLRDVAETNWMNHFIVAASVLRAGAEALSDNERPIGESIVARHNLQENLSLWERSHLELSEALLAQIQVLATLRIFQERVAALETLGVLLNAIGRSTTKGVARTHFEHKPAHVMALYRALIRSSGPSLQARLGWPPLAALEGHKEIMNRCAKLYPKLEDWAKQAAQAYAQPSDLSLRVLGKEYEGFDPRRAVFVVLWHESHWTREMELSPELVIKAYNMVKHAFNATGNYRTYREAAQKGQTAIVLEVPKTDSLIQRLGAEIDLAGVLTREVARMTLELHDLDLLQATAD